MSSWWYAHSLKLLCSFALLFATRSHSALQIGSTAGARARRRFAIVTGARAASNTGVALCLLRCLATSTRAMLGTDVKALLLIPQQTLREEKDRAEARQGELLKRHESERKELEAAFDQLQAKFYQLSELAETSKVR